MCVDKYIDLLKRLIATPSISHDEDATARILSDFLESEECVVERIFNNVIVRSKHSSSSKPTLLLNSHHDTVKAVSGYTRAPFTPVVEGDKLYGLGSNDAGASVVALIATFLHFRDLALPFNIILVISAEEEVSGKDGISAVLPLIGKIDMAIVGEPTNMQVGVAERGLVVLDCISKGKSGHAARNEGINAIEIALDDIARLHQLHLPRHSTLLGPVKFSVTQIDAGTQHNVIPDRCRFVIDVRTTDAYSNEEIVEIVRKEFKSEVSPRSTRLRASAIDSNHPLVQAAKAIGADTFVSPTMSDMALMPFPSIKIGPGDSARSHSADEFIYLSEIQSAIDSYISLITNLQKFF